MKSQTSMKKIIVFLFVVLVTNTKAISQVNLQTGSATFNLPMFNWQDDRSRLNTIVAINYNSGNGLKVTDVASNVGQGWSLLAGGVVTRMQNGEPDDQKPRDGAVEDETKYPPGYLYDGVSASDGCPGALIKYPIFEDENHIYKQHNTVAADKEMDKFAFQVNGRSGVFILGKNNGDKGVILGDSKVKVWFTRNENMSAQGIRTTINAFYVQDENGLIYKFSQPELTKILKSNYCNSTVTEQLSQPQFKKDKVYYEAGFDNTGIVNPYVISGWYLTEVEDALTHRKINFTYVTRNINASAGCGLAYYAEKNYSIISYNSSITQTPEISTIIYPDGHKVQFNYGNARVDLNGAYALASVDVMYNGRYLSRYLLNTSYFILNRYGMPASDFQKRAARLCLQSVQKIGVDLKSDDPPYEFDYYTGSGTPEDVIPPPFCLLKDIWGYYNGDNSRSSTGNIIPVRWPVAALSNNHVKGLCFLREGNNATILNPKAGYAKNGLLKKLVYPEGGSLTYEYGQNTAFLSGQNTSVGGVHVTRTIVTDGGYSNDCTNPIITNYAYTDAANTQSSLWGIEVPKSFMMTVSHYAPEYKKYHWGIRHGCFPLGCCKYKYQYPGILSRNQAISLTGRQQFVQALSVALDILGAVSQVMDIANVIAVQSAGTAAIAALVIDIIGDLINIAITCFSDPVRDYYSTVYYNADLNASNPLPAQFKRVEVVEGTGSNGKTVNEFTNPDDYAIWETTNPALSSKQRFASWAYGLPKKTTIYDNTGKPVKQVENVYDFTYAKVPYAITDKDGNPIWKYPSCKCLVNRTYSQRNIDWSNPSNYTAAYQKQSNSNISVDIYDVITGRVELKTSYQRDYKKADPSQYIETSTEYSYNPDNYQVSGIYTKQSNGELSFKRYRYSGDFNTGVLAKLNQNNMVNEVVSTTSGISGNNGAQFLNETITEFATLADGSVKPTGSFERRTDHPVTPNSTNPWTQYQGSITSTDNPPYQQTQSLSYSATGKLTDMKDEGGRTVANIYDYNDKYVIASVVNAASSDKSAYTSFETQQLGGWVLSGTANYITTTAITGSGSFGLTTGRSLTAASLVTTKAYRLSFWSTTNTITVSSGAVLIQSAPVVNGFTYYEYNIPAGASSVTVSGTGTIDELRVYPQNSRMRTVTYDPAIGKTSESDENNRITYYEYDELGRLRFIKDGNRNIVKMMEYNRARQKKTGPCASTYSNREISEDFTRNNCASGYRGNTVTYTIPAGKYVSAISQAFVDMQAQNELDQLGQAYANTNGTCQPLYYNAAASRNFTKQGCPVGYAGTTVTYTVPAGKYSSVISQAEADAEAEMEIRANGQAYANYPGRASCILDNQPDWIGTGSTRCEMINGGYTGNRQQQVIDQNPNSTSYNQTQWTNAGPDSACGKMLNLTYTNTTGDYTFVRLTNQVTGIKYEFNLSANTTVVTSAGQFPAGQYDVYANTHGFHTVQLYFCSNVGQGSCGGYGEYHPSVQNVTAQTDPMIRIW